MKVWLCFLGFFVVACALPVMAVGDDAATILAHHHAFVGWQADDNSVTSLKLTYIIDRRETPAPNPSAVVTVVPDHAPNVVEYRKGLVYRDTFATGRGLSVGYGYNGKQFWRTDESGNSAIILEQEARFAFTQNIIDAEAVMLVPSTVHGTAQVGSKIVDVVRITPAGGVPADLYVDRVTGAYLREVIDPEDRFDSYSIDILSYRDIAPGKKIIAESRGTTRGAITRLDTAELNPAIDTANLGIPKSDSTWTFASTEPYPITVALQSGSLGRAVHVRASINGHEGTFLLDSGAGISLIYSPYADTIGLEQLGSSSFTGVNGNSVGAKLARVKDLAIGPNVLHNVVVNVATQGGGGGIDGILGFQLLANAIVDIDLAGKTITILDPVKFEATVGKGAFAFPLDLSTFQPGILLSLPKGVVAHPIFDTGAAYNVMLAKELHSSGRVAGLTDTMMYFSGVDGNDSAAATCIRIDMAAGPYRYTQAQTCFAPNDAFGRDGGLIGFDFLRHFNWTFDYPEAKLVLTPNGL
jgi:hypothetical protein